YRIRNITREKKSLKQQLYNTSVNLTRPPPVLPTYNNITSTPVDTDNNIQSVNTIIIAVLIRLAIITLLVGYILYYQKRVRKTTGEASLEDIEVARKVYDN
ncbi:15196_t:CDS:2, partial [Acaulospora morrowiae]